MYILLQGKPAARKSTMMKIGTELLKETGFRKFAPERMSRQAFICEMHAMNQLSLDISEDLDALLDMNVSGDYTYEMTIHASEFVDFIGQNDKDYLMLLTNLWDNPAKYANPKLSKVAVEVNKPCVNMIGCNTPENLNAAFPDSTLGTGTLSRFLFVHCPVTGNKVLFPSMPDKELKTKLINHLKDIKTTVKGPAKLTDEAKEVLQYIYENQKPIDDPRFSYYYGRRLTHLFKLCLVISAMDLRTTITGEDVLLANTILGATEYFMPEALGHFGRSRQSTTVHELIGWIRDQVKPVTYQDIFKQFVSSFNSERDFQSCIVDLQHAGKIVPLNKPGTKEFLGFIVKDAPVPKWLATIMQPELLTRQERSFLGV